MADHPAEIITSGSLPRLGERFEIDPERPIAELRQPHAPAFVARDRDRPAAAIFALICDAEALPRHDVLAALHGLRSPVLSMPRAWGVIDWPASRRRHFALLYDRPLGGRVAEAMSQTIAPIPEDALLHSVLPPLAAALRELAGAGLTHRAIRPTNLFFLDAERRQLAVGDCVSGPPAALQPVACEPIESGLAMPLGRGNGSSADDLYALGATLLFLLLGRMPAVALGAEQLLADKIARGSYNALLGAERLNGALAEAIRGLLADDPRERWGAQELETWLVGRRVSAKPPAIAKRATRPFDVGGQPCYTARAVAHGFARDPLAAMRAARAQDFQVWMQRALGDEERSKALAAALAESQAPGAAAHDDWLISRVACALDPAAPIRYRSVAVAIDGFGPALLAACRGDGSLQHLAETIRDRLPQFWLSVQPAFRPEHVPVLKTFERFRVHLEDRRPGHGVERVLYEMNPRLHCLSPAIEADCVLEAGDVLWALERASSGAKGDEFQLDRHLAAFIAARYRRAGVDWMDALNSGDAMQRVLGALYLLARLQAYKGPAAVPALAQRLARHLPATAERYHNRARRARIKAELPGVVARGNLVDLLSLVDAGTDRQLDAAGFHQAQREYLLIQRRLDNLRADAPRRPQAARDSGLRYAAHASSLMAWLIALATIVAMS